VLRRRTLECFLFFVFLILSLASSFLHALSYLSLPFSYFLLVFMFADAQGLFSADNLLCFVQLSRRVVHFPSCSLQRRYASEYADPLSSKDGEVRVEET